MKRGKSVKTRDKTRERRWERERKGKSGRALGRPFWRRRPVRPGATTNPAHYYWSFTLAVVIFRLFHRAAAKQRWRWKQRQRPSSSYAWLIRCSGRCPVDNKQTKQIHKKWPCQALATATPFALGQTKVWTKWNGEATNAVYAAFDRFQRRRQVAAGTTVKTTRERGAKQDRQRDTKAAKNELAVITE